MTKKNKIYTAGNLTIDDIILYEEQKMYLETTGGNAVFSALGFMIWGFSVNILARKGVDFPDKNVEKLREANITPKLVEMPLHDIRDWALYEPGGARQFINHLSSGSHYDMSITGDQISDNELIGDIYHIAPMPTDVQASIVDRLSSAGCSIALDPHVDYLKDPALNKIAYQMLPKIQYFLPSREEVINLYCSDDLESAAVEFASFGPEIIAIKMSVDGSLVYNPKIDEMVHVPIFPADTVDPTGAGDSYCGGFLAGYLLTGDPLLAACYGTVSASYIVECVGALNALSLDFSDKTERLETVRKNVSRL